MRLGKEKRRFLGTSLGRIVEYFLTVTLVGEIISGEISILFIASVCGFAILLMIFAVYLIPDEEVTI
ncbi:MAG: hypothetical protein QME42_02600 [bacterium]|nr:hypothetical protein [bacterium]